MRSDIGIAIVGFVLTLSVSVEAHASCTGPRSMKGIWKGNDTGTYFVAQRGNTVWWFGQSKERNFANVFRATLRGDIIDGEFSDVAGGFNFAGPLRLQIVRGFGNSIASFKKVSGGFGASHWSFACDDQSVIPARE
ncbi:MULTISPECIES: hypothetical protein [unclassified Bradyrhizobium]